MYERENIKAFHKNLSSFYRSKAKLTYMLVFEISTSQSNTKYTDDLIANSEKNYYEYSVY